MLLIRKALPSEYAAICAFYDSVIDDSQNSPYFPRWQKGICPEYDTLRALVERGEMYLGLIDGHIAAAAAFNHDFRDEYDDVQWLTPAKSEEALIVHLLCVHPAYARRGYARRLVRYAIGLAGQTHCKTIRLDVLEGNLPAECLYTSEGFRYLETRTMQYEDVDPMRFMLYEYPV
jgi:GNAT superfamily N-acetyltransferase